MTHAEAAQILRRRLAEMVPTTDEARALKHAIDALTLLHYSEQAELAQQQRQ